MKSAIASSTAAVATPPAVIAAAKPGKVPAKVASSKKAPRKVAKKAVKAEKIAAPTNGTPLKAFVHEYGLTPKQARVLLRKAWRADAGLLHSLRNRWVFTPTQKRLAITVLRAADRPAIESEDSGDDE